MVSTRKMNRNVSRVYDWTRGMQEAAGKAWLAGGIPCTTGSRSVASWRAAALQGCHQRSFVGTVEAAKGRRRRYQ